MLPFMAAFSFIHAADLHLDAPVGGLGQSLFAAEAEAEALLRKAHGATFAALERLVDLCIALESDFLLLAGDVYNSAQSSLRARLSLRDAFLRLEKHGIGVFLAHGNHDPFKEESGLISWPGNVTVFGSSLSMAPALTRSGEVVARIFGQSHRGPREEKNLAAAFAGFVSARSDPGLFSIGLLHCAVSALAGAHAPYAPCTVEDLRNAALDYWALGHVHAPRLLDSDGKLLSGAPDAASFGLSHPLAAYPGSLQGLHVNESGPRGCLWGRVDTQAMLQLDFLPLAPVRWENPVFTPGPDLNGIPELEEAIMRLLEPLAPGDAPAPALAPELTLARLTLSGRSPLHQTLRQPGALDDLRAHLNAELTGSGLLLLDLILATSPPQDLRSLVTGRDLAGECLRLAEELRASPELLEELAGTALAPFFSKAKVRRALGGDAAPHAEELAALAEEAALLCLELLEQPDSEI